ncbi:hypothetical protein Tco_1497513, partial [Tanacetum coccineum]
VMSSASSAITYTSVYTDYEPGRVFWGADEEISDGGSWKRISDKRTKNKAKTDKTGLGMEKQEKDKVQSTKA